MRTPRPIHLFLTLLILFIVGCSDSALFGNAATMSNNRCLDVQSLPVVRSGAPLTVGGPRTITHHDQYLTTLWRADVCTRAGCTFSGFEGAPRGWDYTRAIPGYNPKTNYNPANDRCYIRNPSVKSSCPEVFRYDAGGNDYEQARRRLCESVSGCLFYDGGQSSQYGNAGDFDVCQSSPLCLEPTTRLVSCNRGTYYSAAGAALPNYNDAHCQQDPNCHNRNCRLREDGTSDIWIWSYLPDEDQNTPPARIGCCPASQCRTISGECIDKDVSYVYGTGERDLICGDTNNWDRCGSEGVRFNKHPGDVSDGGNYICRASQKVAVGYRWMSVEAEEEEVVGYGITLDGGVCIPPTSLIAYYPLEDNARDVVNGNDGIPLGGISFTEGIHGRALGKMISVEDSGTSPLDLDGPFTIMAWVNTVAPAAAVSTHIMMKSSDYHLSLERDRLRFGVFTSGPTRWALGPLSPRFPDGEWTHVAATVDGTNQNRKLYTNGGLVSTRTSSTPAGPYTTNSPLRIGAHLPSSGLETKTDDVMIFNEELSEEQIQSYMEGHCIPSYTLSTSCVAPPDGLVSWWAGDNSVEDLVGDNDGTLMQGYSYREEGLVAQAFNNPDPEAGTSLDRPRLNIPYDSSLAFASDFTIMAWIKTADTDGHIISRGLNYRLVLEDDNFRFDFGAGDGGLRALYGPSSYEEYQLTDDQWTHVAVTVNPERMALYIDGALADIELFTSPPDIDDESDAELNMGQSLEGSIDEVMVYGRSLRQEEIRAIAEAGAYGVCKISIMS